MKRLRILSMGRNQLKKIEKLDDGRHAGRALDLYNAISTLDGFQGLSSLEILYMSNNNLKDFSELEKLSGPSLLRDVLFVGNPMYEGLSPEEQRINVLKFLPNVQKIDGDMVKPAEREAAAAAE